MPPPSRNHLDPTGADTPQVTAASSLDRLSAILTQNRLRTSRSGGRPGERITGRPAAAAAQPRGRAIAHLPIKVCCDDHWNPPWHTQTYVTGMVDVRAARLLDLVLRRSDPFWRI